MDDNLNENDCSIGLSKEGTHAVVTVPIRKYALDHTNGNKLIFGAMREIEFHLITLADQIRMRQKQNGVLDPRGMRPPPDLKVN